MGVRVLVTGAVVALGLGSAANALTVVVNPPVRTRADACSFLSGVVHSPDPFAGASATARRAQKQAVVLSKRAYADICVVHKTLPTPPTAPDGSQHFGAFLNGKPDGLGVRFYVDGSRYVGEWKAGLRQGEGLGVQPDGARYVGHWDDDKPHGKGAVQYHAQIHMTVNKDKAGQAAPAKP
jgi:MORN repeat